VTFNLCEPITYHSATTGSHSRTIGVPRHSWTGATVMTGTGNAFFWETRQSLWRIRCSLPLPTTKGTQKENPYTNHSHNQGHALFYTCTKLWTISLYVPCVHDPIFLCIPGTSIVTSHFLTAHSVDNQIPQRRSLELLPWFPTVFVLFTFSIVQRPLLGCLGLKAAWDLKG
jgi:hypothetical protein